MRRPGSDSLDWNQHTADCDCDNLYQSGYTARMPAVELMHIGED